MTAQNRSPGRPFLSAPTPIEPDSIAGRIRARRMDLGFSQCELAETLDPPTVQTVIYMAESGRRDVAHGLVVRIARAMDCDPCDLDVKLAPAGAVVMVRERSDGKIYGHQWVALAESDRVKLAAFWGFGWVGPGELRFFLDRAAEAGVAVVLRGDLATRAKITTLS